MICKHCGAQMPEGMRFCTVCGNSLEGPYLKEDNSPAAMHKTSFGKRVLFCLIGILLTFLLVGVGTTAILNAAPAEEEETDEEDVVSAMILSDQE